MSRSGADSQDVNEDKGRPLLITLSAHALSSIGFGLSIIAISIQWLLADSSLNGDRIQEQIMDRSQLHGHLRPKANSRLSLPANYGSSAPLESPRRHTKRVTFASITVDSKSREHEQTITYISKRIDHDTTSLNSTLSDVFPSMPSTTCQPGAGKGTGIAPSREKLTSPTTSQLERHAKAASTGEDILTRNTLIEGSPERKLTWTSRAKLVTNDLRSQSPVERVSRHLADLRLARSAPLGRPKPKRAHTVPIPHPSLFKSRNRRSEPAPRTLPYEAPYFALPPEPAQ